MTKLRQVGLDFLDSAPRVYEFEAILDAPPERVFAALSAQPTTWTWFPGVKGFPYEGAEPFGVGTKRSVRATGVTYRETIVAWDEPERWAYRIDETTAPVAKSLVEEWTMQPQGNGALVRWRFAIDPRIIFRLGGPLVRIGMRAMFRRAMSNLERTLTTSG